MSLLTGTPNFCHRAACPPVCTCRLEARGTLENEEGTGRGLKDAGTPLAFKCHALELVGRKVRGTHPFLLGGPAQFSRVGKAAAGPEPDALSSIRLRSPCTEVVRT